MIFNIRNLEITNFFDNLIVSFSEQQRENDKALRKAGRDIERERRKLEDEEKKIVSFE